MSEKEMQSHESFGMIGGSRVQGTDRVLFGSSIQHGNTIVIRLSHAKVGRDLSHDFYYDDKVMFEVELSSTQFAEFITGLNAGRGVPCTIRYANTEGFKKMENPPFVSKIKEFQNEFQSVMDEMGDKVSEGWSDVKDLILNKDRINKEDRKAIVSYIERFISELTSSMPFVSNQFAKQMERTVTESRQEVEAFLMHEIIERGLASLKEDVLKFPEERVQDITED